MTALSVTAERNLKYTVEGFSWSPADATFQDGKNYTLTVLYKAKANYGFYPDTEFSLNGNSMNVVELVQGQGGTAKVSYTFRVGTQVEANDMYRLYNPNAGDHHYAMSAQEKDDLVAIGWRYEGIGWYGMK